MKVSVLSPVLNRQATVEESYRSLYSQTYKNFEHIVQDGGSSDATLRKILEVGDTRTFIASEPDAGVYDALNRAFARSTGEVVCCLHSDDRLMDDFIIARVMEMFVNDDADIVYGNLVYQAAAGNRVLRKWRAGEYSKLKLYYGWMAPHPAVFVKASLLRATNAYDERYEISGDYDALIRWFTYPEARIQYLDHFLISMQVGGISNRNMRSLAKKMREDLEVIERHGLWGWFTLLMKNLRKLPQFVGSI